MRRIRLTLLLLSAALLIALVLLVDSALRRVSLESGMRHQALAERVFDEMERSLSTVLDDVERAPETASFPFILGRLDVDAMGNVAARDQAEKRNRKEEESADEKQVEKLIRDSLADSGRAQRPIAPPPAPVAAQAAQVPGTTVEVGKKQKDDGGLLASASELGAMRTLNKAVQERADKRLAYRGYGEPEEADLGVDAAAAAPAEPKAKDLRGDSLDAGPMRGRVVDADHLLLFRTAVREGKAVREGVLVDLDTLETWLRSQALSDVLVRYATLSFESPFAPAAGAAEPAGVFSYRHRFAEPFSELSAHLVLRPLPGSSSGTLIYALAALLLVTGVLGIAAVYRMVSVVVGFAERRSNFVAAVSHELKTPLTAIRMYGEMLRDGLVSSEAKRDEYYRHITVESERLSRLINNVLEFSHLEKGTREVALTSGSVAPIVREVADLVRSHAEEQGFELAVEIEDGLPSVRFDRDALMQVLWNLVDNAVKYARGATPQRITLACHGAGGGVAIAVRDHGPGVPPRQLEKIFEPFYRVESELSRRNKGTGLGLALVRGLVERMAGTVEARNLAGGGFEVEILLR